MATEQQGFPVDDVTLHLLIASCGINPDTGQSHVQDFLFMGAREKSREDITHEVGDGEGAPVYFVDYEEGYEPFSVNDALVALAEEVLRLRAAGPKGDSDA